MALTKEDVTYICGIVCQDICAKTSLPLIEACVDSVQSFEEKLSALEKITLPSITALQGGLSSSTIIEKLSDRLQKLEERLQLLFSAVDLSSNSRGYDEESSKRLDVIEQTLRSTAESSGSRFGVNDTLSSRVDMIEQRLEHQADTRSKDHDIAEWSLDLVRGGNSEQVLKRLDMLEQHIHHQTVVSKLDHEVEESAVNENKELSKDSQRIGYRESTRPRAYQEYYEFCQSTWDMMIFFDLGVISLSDSILGSLVTYMLLFVQTVFAVIVARSMTENPLTGSSVDELRQWRLTQGHHVDHYDSYSNSSLVARVCDGSLELITSAAQQSLYSDLDDYLGRESSSNGLNDWLLIDSNGILLSLMCAFVWTLICQSELSLIIRMAKALWIKRSDKTTVVRDEDEFELVELSRCRLLFTAVVVIVPRLLVLFVLYLYGCLFLFHTISMGELILNALALAFILDLDDQMFEVLAPFSAKVMLSNMRSVVLASRSKTTVIDWHALTSMVVLVVLVFIMYFSILQGFVESARSAHNVICGGDRNFVVARNKATGLLYSHPTHPRGRDATKLAPKKDDQYIMNVMERLANLDSIFSEADKLQYSIRRLDIDYLQKINSLPEEATASLYECIDRLVLFDGAALDVVGNYFATFLTGSYKDCNSLRPFCSAYQVSSSIRTLCPITCDCHNPLGGMFDLQGCSKTCVDLRRKQVEQLNCSSVSTKDSPDFNRWFLDYQDVLSTSGNIGFVYHALGFSNHSYTLGERARDMGCDLVGRHVDSGITTICEWWDTYANMLGYCPKECGICG